METKVTLETVHWREGHHMYQEGKGADPTPGTPGMGDLHWEDGSPYHLALKTIGLNFVRFLKLVGLNT